MQLHNYKQEIRSVEHGICPIAEFTMAELCSNFGDSAMNMDQVVFFIAHAQNGLIYTSCQNSDVTIVFVDPDFL